MLLKEDKISVEAISEEENSVEEKSGRRVLGQNLRISQTNIKVHTGRSRRFVDN